MSNLCSSWSLHYCRPRAAVTLYTFLTEHISKVRGFSTLRNNPYFIPHSEESPEAHLSGV